jgi:Flp pilus assembly protein TadG
MLFQRFLDDRRGSVVPLLALAAIPITGLIGASVDYSRAAAVQTSLQAAVDSTALAMAKSASTLSQQQLQTNATSYFSAVFTRTDAATPNLSVTYSANAPGTGGQGGSQVLVSATSSVSTLFMGIMGFHQLPIYATSTSTWGNKRLRVALVLDNTGSMSQGGAGTVASPNKIQALKTATHNLLTQLQNSAVNAGDVYVSIIPFTKDVNVNAGDATQSWVDWTAWEAEPANLDTNAGGAKPSSWDTTGPGSDCPFTTNSHGFKCTKGPASSGASTTSTIPGTTSTYAGLICPSLDDGAKNATHASSYYNGCYDSTKFTQTGSSASCSGHSNCTCSGSGSSKTCGTNSGYWEHTWRPASNATATPAHSTWNGCVTDRDQNSDTLNTAPGTGALFPTEQYSVCPVGLLAQTYDWTALSSKVDAMVAAGNTNQAIGLAWGWQSLTAGSPLSAPSKDANYQYQDIIIILSDGLNTQNRWSTDASTIDARQETLCDNIKSAGVTIYAVQVNTGNDPTSSVLQYCAGTRPQVADSGKFFLLTSAGEIVTTFSQIGTGLSKLRLAN